jgi:hypothetical protein
VLRSIAELAAYGTLAVLLAVASLTPASGNAAGSATTTESSALSYPGVPSYERGARLFAVKGCTGCHMHASFPNARMQIGPDLSGLAVSAASRVAGLDARAYVRQSLREPGAYRASTSSTALMPDLQLSDEQIESLTAFLLTPTR